MRMTFGKRLFTTPGNGSNWAWFLGIIGINRYSMGKEVEDRHPGQNYQSTNCRITKILAECETQQNCRDSNKQERNNGITPYPIRPRHGWIASSKHEHRAGGDHVKEPFREYRQRKKLSKISAQQKQRDCKYRLHDDGGRRRVELGMNVSQR